MSFCRSRHFVLGPKLGPHEEPGARAVDIKLPSPNSLTHNSSRCWGGGGTRRRKGPTARQLLPQGSRFSRTRTARTWRKVKRNVNTSTKAGGEHLQPNICFQLARRGREALHWRKDELCEKHVLPRSAASGRPTPRRVQINTRGTQRCSPPQMSLCVGNAEVTQLQWKELK